MFFCICVQGERTILSVAMMQVVDHIVFKIRKAVWKGEERGYLWWSMEYVGRRKGTQRRKGWRRNRRSVSALSA